MNRYAIVVLACLLGCRPAEPPPFEGVQIEVVYRDSVSIRALEVMPGSVGFGGSDGVFGSLDTRDWTVRTARLQFEGTIPEFRAVGHTASDFFLLSAGDPALLYKTGDDGQMKLVYQEHGPGVFYDSMAFWDDQNGMAVGDARAGCLSVLLTRDGGHTWARLPCEALPEALPGEGAFAASDTNIAIVGNACWVVTSRARIFHSPDLGKTWEVWETPLRPETATTGLYSLDFYDADHGYAIGGDYTRPEWNGINKLQTADGGRTWEVRAAGQPPGYMSCVRYVPGRKGRDLVAVGFNGLVYSGDSGASWRQLSDTGFYSLRFLDDSTAVASGKGVLARLRFR